MTKETTTKTLLAEDATIQERQVTVRVLTIGTKQITQALYRQLVEESVIDDETGYLKGEVWGWVNLHVDCDVKGRHLHAIWEDNGQLKRSGTRLFTTGQKDPVSEQYYYLQEELKDRATIYVCLAALANRRFNHWESYTKSRMAGIMGRLSLTVKGISISVPVPDRVESFFNAPTQIKEWSEMRDQRDDKEYYQKNIDYLKNSVKEFLSGGLKDCFHSGEWKEVEYLNPEQYTTYDEACKAMEEVAEKMNTLEQNWKQSYKTIEDTGQLFIAVSGVWK